MLGSLKDKAARGDRETAYVLGGLYEGGYSGTYDLAVKTDLPTALEFYKKAAKGKDETAKTAKWKVDSLKYQIKVAKKNKQ